MNKKILILLIMLLIFSSAVFAIKTFILQETEKISLQANAEDPDKDKLVTIYGWPLNENGEWLTKYGDAGEYKTKITVSDGTRNVSQDVLIIVNRKEEPPAIDSFSPMEDSLSINESNSINFEISATDVNNDNLAYRWYVDDKKVKDGKEFLFETDFNDAGRYKISAVVSDGTQEKRKEWYVNVADVNADGMVDGIEDVSADENETVRLELPDFEKYRLTYTISEPIGNNNEWKTTFNDAGIYDVKVHVQGKGFAKNKTVKVTVRNVDRAPVFESIGNMTVNENEELKIILNAYDPDGDEITYSASSLPEGAKLEGNVFTWKPGFDTVPKEGFVNWLIDKFNVLTKSFSVQFTASSKDKKAVQNVILTVRGAVKPLNRAPVFSKINDIKASEGDSIAILLNANDPDGDAVTYSIDNPPENSTLKGNAFLWTPKFQIANKGESKKFELVFSASDGKLETRQIVKAEIGYKNRPPRIINSTKNVIARVNKPVLMFVKAVDDDNDELSYTWDFGFLEKYKATPTHQRIFVTTGTKTVKVTVSDGTDSTEQIINVNVI